MGKYLKKFSTDSARVEYEGSENYIEPYVSYVEVDNTVHYNKPETRLIVKYNVTDTSNPTPLFVGAESVGFPASAIYDKIEIDNVEIDMSNLSSSEQEGMTVYSYGFTSGGQHTVKYTLKDPTVIGAEFDEETGMPSKIGATFVRCPITSVEIPNSVTSIGNSAFGNCGSLTNVTIPDSITSIGNASFCNCSGLTSIVMPDSVTSIGMDAFFGCNSITSCIIGNGVTRIDNRAFRDCFSLTSVTVEATTPPTLGSSAFSNTNNCPIYVPSASVETYKAASGWSSYASRIHEIGEGIR